MPQKPWDRYEQQSGPWEKYAAVSPNEQPESKPSLQQSVTDMRSAGEIATDQALNVIKGIPGLITSIPSGIKAALTGDVGTLVKGAMQPYTTSIRGAAALVAPSSIEAPSRVDWEQAALGAGALMAGVALGALAPKIAAGAGRLPENLMARAAANRANIPPPPSVFMPRTAIGTALEFGRRTYGRVAAPIQEMAARAMAARGPFTHFELPEGSVSEIAPSVDVPKFAKQNVSTAADVRSRELMKSVASDRPPLTTGEPSPSTPLNIPRPEVPRFLQMELEQMRNQPKSQVNPLTAIEEAIAPSGRRAKISTLRTAPQLQDVPELQGLKKGLPFDQGLMDAFKRVEADVGSAEEAISPEIAVPKAPIVDNLLEMVADYRARGLEKIASVLEKETGKWNKLPDSIPWEEFRNRKRAFFQEYSSSSAPMRRAYGVLMDASAKYSGSKALQSANKAYSVVRQAIDAAGIDPKTGRRIADVGKPNK